MWVHSGFAPTAVDRGPSARTGQESGGLSRASFRGSMAVSHQQRSTAVPRLEPGKKAEGYRARQLWGPKKCGGNVVSQLRKAENVTARQRSTRFLTLIRTLSKYSDVLAVFSLAAVTIECRGGANDERITRPSQVKWENSCSPCLGESNSSVPIWLTQYLSSRAYLGRNRTTWLDWAGRALRFTIGPGATIRESQP